MNEELITKNVNRDDYITIGISLEAMIRTSRSNWRFYRDNCEKLYYRQEHMDYWRDNYINARRALKNWITPK